MEENFKENRKLTKKDYKKIFENIKKSYKFVKSNKKSLIICIIVSILTIPVRRLNSNIVSSDSFSIKEV